MLQRITYDPGPDLRGVRFRYDLLHRASTCFGKRGATLLAWGFGPDGLRLVVEGDPKVLRRACRGLRVGTTHALIRSNLVASARLRRDTTEDLFGAVLWAHSGPVEDGAGGPLASPWSSHRDLLQFRRAPFYDAAVLVGRVSSRHLHEAAGGDLLPNGWPPPAHACEDLSLLLRIAAAVLGVLPADRRCFRLFVHLAKYRGWTNAWLADALALTTRRIRQLATTPEPDLDLALMTLADPRLSQVP